MRSSTLPNSLRDNKWVGVDGWKHGEGFPQAHVLIFSVEDGTVKYNFEGSMPSWSADGTHVAYCKSGRDRGVYLRNLEAELDIPIDRNGWAIQWAPDGRKVAYIRGNGIVVYDLIEDTKKVIETPYSSIYHNPEWSGDSKRICFLGRSPRQAGICRRECGR